MTELEVECLFQNSGVGHTKDTIFSLEIARSVLNARMFVLEANVDIGLY